ncbi:hypothetical protein B0T17DRAFT_508189 [Bombardia bombarda]|uniref:OTU domain-containing protein n=1 Tax=Bombardia bombarda TaxID=252184 RepID=A0AA39X0U5_9PEZI|nr:hypothetical protein B0T17DRAFT_508189 [Bombardia bombarda]
MSQVQSFNALEAETLFERADEDARNWLRETLYYRELETIRRPQPVFDLGPQAGVAKLGLYRREPVLKSHPGLSHVLGTQALTPQSTPQTPNSPSPSVTTQTTYTSNAVDLDDDDDTPQIATTIPPSGPLTNMRPNVDIEKIRIALGYQATFGECFAKEIQAASQDFITEGCEDSDQESILQNRDWVGYLKRAVSQRPVLFSGFPMVEDVVFIRHPNRWQPDRSADNKIIHDGQCYWTSIALLIYGNASCWLRVKAEHLSFLEKVLSTPNHPRHDFYKRENSHNSKTAASGPGGLHRGDHNIWEKLHIPGCWTGDEMMLLTADVYGVFVVLYKYDSVDTFKWVNKIYDMHTYGAYNSRHIFICYFAENHYEPMIPNNYYSYEFKLPRLTLEATKKYKLETREYRRLANDSLNHHFRGRNQPTSPLVVRPSFEFEHLKWAAGYVSHGARSGCGGPAWAQPSYTSRKPGDLVLSSGAAPVRNPSSSTPSVPVTGHLVRPSGQPVVSPPLPTTFPRKYISLSGGFSSAGGQKRPPRAASISSDDSVRSLESGPCSLTRGQKRTFGYASISGDEISLPDEPYGKRQRVEPPKETIASGQTPEGAAGFSSQAPPSDPQASPVLVIPSPTQPPPDRKKKPRTVAFAASDVDRLKREGAPSPDSALLPPRPLTPFYQGFSPWEKPLQDARTQQGQQPRPSTTNKGFSSAHAPGGLGRDAAYEAEVATYLASGSDDDDENDFWEEGGKKADEGMEDEGDDEADGKKDGEDGDGDGGSGSENSSAEDEDDDDSDGDEDVQGNVGANQRDQDGNSEASTSNALSSGSKEEEAGALDRQASGQANAGAGSNDDDDDDASSDSSLEVRSYSSLFGDEPEPNADQYQVEVTEMSDSSPKTPPTTITTITTAIYRPPRPPAPSPPAPSPPAPSPPATSPAALPPPAPSPPPPSPHALSPPPVTPAPVLPPTSAPTPARSGTRYIAPAWNYLNRFKRDMLQDWCLRAGLAAQGEIVKWTKSKCIDGLIAERVELLVRDGPRGGLQIVDEDSGGVIKVGV